MKNKGAMYALLLGVLDVIAVASVVNSGADPAEEEYSNALVAAQQYEEQDLNYKAISEYSRALGLRESYDLRMKIADLYESGYENGEFSDRGGMIQTLDTVTSSYPKNADAYDRLISYYGGYENYEKCAEYVRKARNNNTESDTINEYFELLRHKFTEYSCAYENVEHIGNYILATRNVTDYVEDRDDEGNIIYETDDNGEMTAVTSPRDYTEYTCIYSDGSRSEPYKAVDMSPPVNVTFSSGAGAVAYFCKNYGNDLVSGESSREIYSYLVVNGVRQCYIGESNEYTARTPFGSGILSLYNEKTKKYDLFNTSGTKAGEGFDYAGCFGDDVCYVIRDGKKRVLRRSNEDVFDGGIEDIVTGFGDRCSVANRMFVKLPGEKRFKMYATDTGSPTGFECDDADLFYDGSAAFCKNGRWGFVLADGTVESEPKYDEARSYSNGYAAVKQGNKWGYINKRGEVIIPPAYDEALYFGSDGTAYVRSGDKWYTVKLYYME